MVAYMVGQLEIFDPERFNVYLAGFMPIFLRHGGEFLARPSGTTTVVEGEWSHPRTVIMKFPSREKAEALLADPEYRTLVQHRYASANANLAIIDGLE